MELVWNIEYEIAIYGINADCSSNRLASKLVKIPDVLHGYK